MPRDDSEKKRSHSDRKEKRHRDRGDEDGRGGRRSSPTAPDSPALDDRYRPESSSAARDPLSSRDYQSRDPSSRDGGGSSGRHRRDDRSRSPGDRPSDRKADKRSRHRSRSRDGSVGEERRHKRSRLDGDGDGSDGGSGGGRPRSRSREQQRSRLGREEPSRGRDEARRSAERATERRKAKEVAEAAAIAEARDDALRAKEAMDLDAEMEKRRKRIEAWQASQRSKTGGSSSSPARMGTAGASAAGLPDAADGPSAGFKKWSFEDEESDEDDPLAAGGGAAGGGAAASNGLPALKPLGGADDDDEVDPLDAFMAGNSAAAGAAPSPAKPERVPVKTEDKMDTGSDEEVDPLDAFMADLPASTAPKQKVKSRPAAPKVILKLETLKGAGITGPAASAPTTIVPTRAPAVANGQVEGAPPDEEAPPAPGSAAAKAAAKKRRALRRRYYESDDSSDDSEGGDSSDLDDAEWARNVQQGKLTKGDRLGPADHSKIDYAPFRRNFYIEVPELARMSDEAVAASRKDLDEIKVRGKNVPRPVKSWNQCGLSGRILEVLRKAGMTDPMPIQAQALPIIMSGRDCIGVAKTGSGKTFAFVLPMLRHIKDQPPLQQNDGPIALIMAPTRELVQQIGKDIKRFTKALNINCTCVYGGSGVANQITELKRGTEVVVCTPGRMIDILVTSGGKITNLRRVTYLVLDEADRMFDMGFEPQISRIVNNIRPDRQTVMFSATFPRSVEVLARQVLQSPVEIQVGGRSVVNKDITQLVEIREEEDRFLRLLEVLGTWYERGKVLIFVQSQDKCDTLFRDLLKSGYPCLSLHGGKDQADRESTISDFKSNVCNVLVATSVAARGLDVKELVLVVNYEVPNHHEDYVHRVGRTGRAGAKGTAITFIAPGEERYAPDLVKALKESGAPVPKDLEAMAESFGAKRKAGTVQAHGSGFGGSGFKFNAEEDERHNNERKGIVKEYGLVEQADSDDEAKGQEGKVEHVQSQVKGPVMEVPAAEREAAAAAALAATSAATPGGQGPPGLPLDVRARIAAAQELANRMSSQSTVTTLASGIRRVVPTVAGGALPPPPPVPTPQPQQEVSAIVRAAQAAAARIQPMGMPGMPGMQMQPQHMGMPHMGMPAHHPPGQSAEAAALEEHRARMLRDNPGIAGLFDPLQPHFESELEINDFPQHARWKITHRETLREITELTGAAVTTRGIFIMPRAPVPEGERKLALLIQGPTEQTVKSAKVEIKRILEETTEKAMRREGGAGGTQGRYSIM